MSSDLYKFTVEYLGPPSGRIDALPMLTPGTRALAKCAKLADAQSGPVEALLETLTATLQQAGAKGARTAIPADKSAKKKESDIVRQALLHRLYGDAFPPKLTLAIFDVEALQGQVIPTRHSIGVLLARFLWETDPEHPLRAKYTQEKIFAKNFYVPETLGVEYGALTSGKTRGKLCLLAPPVWFANLSAGTTYGTVAFA